MKGGVLTIDGVGAKEMLSYERELGDGMLRVAWRLRKADGESPMYNGDIHLRTPLDR